jgi:hypothetical protein
MPRRYKSRSHDVQLRNDALAEHMSRGGQSLQCPVMSLWRSRLRRMNLEIPRVPPGDLKQAKTILARLTRLSDMGGYTDAEWANLARAKRTWTLRSKGLDARFNIIGNRRGRPNADEKRRIQIESRRIKVETPKETGISYLRKRRFDE